jgi:predicted AAA+ superfamily ATPase
LSYLDAAPSVSSVLLTPSRGFVKRRVAPRVSEQAGACDTIGTSRAEHGAEVDFIVETEHEVWAIELKASRHVNRTDLRGMHSFADFFGKKHHALVLYLGTERRRLEAIDILPWQEGLQALGL